MLSAETESEATGVDSAAVGDEGVDIGGGSEGAAVSEDLAAAAAAVDGAESAAAEGAAAAADADGAEPAVAGTDAAADAVAAAATGAAPVLPSAGEEFVRMEHRRAGPFKAVLLYLDYVRWLWNVTDKERLDREQPQGMVSERVKVTSPGNKERGEWGGR